MKKQSQFFSDPHKAHKYSCVSGT